MRERIFVIVLVILTSAIAAYFLNGPPAAQYAREMSEAEKGTFDLCHGLPIPPEFHLERETTIAKNRIIYTMNYTSTENPAAFKKAIVDKLNAENWQYSLKTQWEFIFRTDYMNFKKGSYEIEVMINWPLPFFTTHRYAVSCIRDPWPPTLL